jgi:hypothetical protein
LTYHHHYVILFSYSIKKAKGDKLMCDNCPKRFTAKEKAQYHDYLDEIASDYCPAGTYCILKELLISHPTSRRVLTQLKNLDRMKLLESKSQGKDIGWDKTIEIWIEKGYAKKFADLYSYDKKEKDLFNEIVK